MKEMPAMSGKDAKAKMEERRANKPKKVSSVRPVRTGPHLEVKELKAKLAEQRAIRRALLSNEPNRATIMPVPPKPGKRKIGRPVPPKKRG